MRHHPTFLPALLLTIAALLFGATFVVVKDTLTTLSPLSFVGWRFSLGALALGAIGFPRGKAIWRDGSIAGLILFASYALQTIGLARTSASNSGLITGLYVIATPLIAAAVSRRRPRVTTGVGAVAAFIGFSLLSFEGSVAINVGDILTVLAAIGFALHIVVVSRLAGRHRVVPFTAVQLSITAIASLVLSGSAGRAIPDAEVWPALVFTGVVVSAGAILIQVWSQTKLGPARTAIVLALEPLFAAVTAALVLGERLGGQGLLGGGVIIGAIFFVLNGIGTTDDPILSAEALAAPRLT
jgi:drug/metabolite transporter (DMT)-like permease